MIYEEPHKQHGYNPSEYGGYELNKVLNIAQALYLAGTPDEYYQYFESEGLAVRVKSEKHLLAYAYQ